jgi:hypothetical protein
MSRLVAVDGFDGDAESEPIAQAHSWQAWSISRENFQAGRTDLKARDVHFATYPNFAPTRAELETRARQCGFQYAMLQHYGAAVGERQKLISEDTELFDFSTGRAAPKPTNELQRDNPAESINRTADAIREAKSLLQEIAPERRAESALTRENVAELINDALSKLQPAPAREPSDLDKLRELVKFNSELQALTTPATPAPTTSEMSDKERVERAMVKELRVVPEMFRAMREALNTSEKIDEPPSLTTQLLGVLRDGVLPYVMPSIAPRVGAKLVALMDGIDDKTLMNAITPQQQQQPARAQQVATPQPQPQPPAATKLAAEQPAEAPPQDPIDAFVFGVKEDILEDNDPSEAVNDAVKIYFEHPQYQPLIVGMLERSNEALLQLFQQASGVDLSQLANANGYLDGLRDGVRSRLMPVNVASDAVSSNGNAGAAAEAAG